MAEPIKPLPASPGDGAIRLQSTIGFSWRLYAAEAALRSFSMADHSRLQKGRLLRLKVMLLSSLPCCGRAPAQGASHALTRIKKLSPVYPESHARSRGIERPVRQCQKSFVYVKKPMIFSVIKLFFAFRIANF